MLDLVERGVKRMKIQEMRSGILHLNKRMENQASNNYRETREIEVESGSAFPMASDCELDDPRWSVISFTQVEAGGLTYKQAAALMSELDSYDAPGLCIVTDEVAERIRP